MVTIKAKCCQCGKVEHVVVENSGPNRIWPDSECCLAILVPVEAKAKLAHDAVDHLHYSPRETPLAEAHAAIDALAAASAGGGYASSELAALFEHLVGPGEWIDGERDKVIADIRRLIARCSQPRPELPSEQAIAEALLGEWVAAGEPCILTTIGPLHQEAWMRVARYVLSLLRGEEGEK